MYRTNCDKLLDRFGEINQSIRQAHQQEEVPDSGEVTLQGGTRETDPQREKKRG